ncbi:BZ3500_MvSof-1268-A1-R1_Chr8-1g09783 [Microbotryum saponariae]|uniref:BZ3500_MvSof-1268-A1-R1_Chr8-1g09783 protein n=1 Tax=Microbotryum saponariae TaxID=289078 RepID=A0A2X0MUK2_9BASI|nr:BZ3500_MvSof-1268-A1-R1_Chr8-1g09783 [Microbotryum saponariae]SDA08069.1 BZ3501_MvSof-1269-A2-R1_Chr8-1g09506 [Microbotryum saponariae]
MERLPPEVLLSIFELLVVPADRPIVKLGPGPSQPSLSLRAPTTRRVQANLVQAAASHSSFTWPALAALYGTAPCVTSLQSLAELTTLLSERSRTKVYRNHQFLTNFEHGANNLWPNQDQRDDVVDWSLSIHSLYIVCLRTNEKHWGPAIARLLSLVPNLRKLVLHRIDDLRPKHIMGSGVLQNLVISATSFKANSLPAPVSWAQTFASITHLALRNIGLPQPSTHVATGLSMCCSTIQHLELAYLRDLNETRFAQLLAILADDCPRLESLDMDGLSVAQVHTLCFPSGLFLPNQDDGDTPLLRRIPVTRLRIVLNPVDMVPVLYHLPSTLRVLDLRTFWKGDELLSLQRERQKTIGAIIADILAKRFDRRLSVTLSDRPDADRVQSDFDSLWLRSEAQRSAGGG